MRAQDIHTAHGDTVRHRKKLTVLLVASTLCAVVGQVSGHSEFFHVSIFFNTYMSTLWIWE